MSEMLEMDEICSVLQEIHGNLVIESDSRNWFRVLGGAGESVVYVSQCKPSAYGRGNWYYEFFHSIGESAIQKILDSEARMLLIDYMNRRYAYLSSDDIGWAIENSSRFWKNKGEVTDFVIKESESGFYLCPTISGTDKFRDVEVFSFQ